MLKITIETDNPQHAILSSALIDAAFRRAAVFGSNSYTVLYKDADFPDRAEEGHKVLLSLMTMKENFPNAAHITLIRVKQPS